VKGYTDLLLDVLENGEERIDRTGTGTLSVFGRQTRYDISNSFPAVTTKKLFFRGVKEELLWLLRGETNVKPLQDKDVNIWNAWANSIGDLGPVYGEQWRSWRDYTGKEHDQIKEVIKEIKVNPTSRRLIVSAWNVGDLVDMALVPCHLLFQFYVSKGRLSCQLYQRSGDLFLGIPFNIASYAMLTSMIAQVTGLKTGELIHTIGDAHIYSNHIDQVKEQLSRNVLPPPVLFLNPEVKDIDDFKSEDIALLNYTHHKTIKAPVAI